LLDSPHLPFFLYHSSVEMAEVSEAELLQICTTFLLAAPPGEFNEVVTDVRGLLNNDALLNRNANETFRTYNTDQMIQVQNGDHEALITKHGEIGNNEYLDPIGGNIISYDHIKQKVTGTRPISGELDSSVESFRKAIEDAVSHYVSEHYQNGTPGVYSGKEGGDSKVVICISSSKFNPNNFWNGRWRSVHIIRFKPGGQAKVESNIRVNVHYYEDGNVQLVANFKKTPSFNVPSDAKGLAEAVLKQIQKQEQDYQTALEHSYNTMGETTFKALRRVLPITREKIKWEKIKNYKMGSEIAK